MKSISDADGFFVLVWINSIYARHSFSPGQRGERDICFCGRLRELSISPMRLEGACEVAYLGRARTLSEYEALLDECFE